MGPLCAVRETHCLCVHLIRAQVDILPWLVLGISVPVGMLLTFLLTCTLTRLYYVKKLSSMPYAPLNGG